MLFNSLNFLYFFTGVFLLVWATRNQLILRNSILLLANYFFYMSWAPKFAIVLSVITIFSFIVALLIDTYATYKKLFLSFGIITLLGSLIFFKYKLFSQIKFFNNSAISSWVLPLGMSYYTLIAIGYIVDVSKNKIVASKNMITYATYMSFFPQILSGPISQATQLLPQFSSKNTLTKENMIKGFGFIAWGLFKKVIVSSSLSISVSYIFKNHEILNGSDLFIGLLLYSCQVYADFSGYSDMAFGLALLLGFNIIQNFKMPFFSTSISEFWRKWHTSLSMWLREYIYIPLGGNKNTFIIRILLLLFTFTMSGAWHGATANFLIWGTLNGILYIAELLIKKITPSDKNIFVPSIIMMIIVFVSISLTRVWFYTNDTSTALSFYNHMFSASLLKMPDISLFNFTWVLIMLLVSYVYNKYPMKLESIKYHLTYKLALSISSIVVVVWYMHQHTNSSEYIYFKF